MKKIIIPVDFSEHSEFALQTAALLAKKFDSELLVLHMLELSNMMYSASATDRQEEVIFYLKLAEQKFETFLDKPYLKGLKITPIVKHFKVFSEVNAIAKAHEADFVVMGSHGSSGFKEFVIGSNAEKVIRYSEIPVLIVKKPVESIDFSSMIFVTNFDKETAVAYNTAKSLAHSFEASLNCINVNIPTSLFMSSSELETKIEKFIQYTDSSSGLKEKVIRVSDYSVEKGIINYVHTHQTDLIIVPTHGRRGIDHFLSGSIAEDIVNHSNSLIMTVKIG